MALIQYFKDTKAELRHVAWPTQVQTIVYTALVALMSIAIALYLGFFDFLFTTTLGRLIGVAPAAPTSEQVQIQELPQFSTTTVQ